jgi:hypothetical protein
LLPQALNQRAPAVVLAAVSRNLRRVKGVMGGIW